MAQLSTTISHAQSATAFHFLISKRLLRREGPAPLLDPSPDGTLTSIKSVLAIAPSNNGLGFQCPGYDPSTAFAARKMDGYDLRRVARAMPSFNAIATHPPSLLPQVSCYDLISHRTGLAKPLWWCNRRTQCCKTAAFSQESGGFNPFDFRSWADGGRLPAAVEAILLEDVLSSGEALAEDDKLGSGTISVPEAPATPAPAQGVDSVTDNVLGILFGAAALGLAVLTVGVIYISVTDFLDNRKSEAMQKEAAEKEKKTKKKAEPVSSSRPGPRGFGQSRKDRDQKV